MDLQFLGSLNRVEAISNVALQRGVKIGLVGFVILADLQDLRR